MIVPEEVDVAFLKSFKKFILNRIGKGDKFILVAGGGKLARKYQQAAIEVTSLDNEEKDWLGLHSTRLNGHLLRTIFKERAHPMLVTNYVVDLDKFSEVFSQDILVGAGWKPGWSTDYVTVLMAKKFNASSVINLSNIEYVYSEDPRVNPSAKKYEKISWDEFKEIVGSKWDPGMSAPFDPIATKLASEIPLDVAIMNGKDLENLGKYLDGKDFKGTLIS